MTSSEAVGNASVIVLTGGKSSRMGAAKFLLPFDGEPLIAHLVRRLANRFNDVVVVAAPEQELPPLPARILRDELPHQGPVGGIYYGLRAAAEEISFVTACDAPFLNLAVVEFLLSPLGDADVGVRFWQERLQPLHAVYRRTVLPLLKQQLDAGLLRPTLFYDKVKTRVIAEAELSAVDPAGLSFINFNTPAEYQDALQRWRAG